VPSHRLRQAGRIGLPMAPEPTSQCTDNLAPLMGGQGKVVACQTMGKRSEKELTKLRDEVYKAVISPAMMESNSFFNSPKAPRYLVHFTSTETLTKILQNRTLRLHRVKASNDPMELEYGIKMALTVLDALRRSARDDLFKMALQRGFDGKLSDGTKRVVIEPHALCFTQTKKVNAVAHWAMYGRNGSGVALKFSGRALERIANDQDVGLAKVVYDARRQREILKGLLKFFRAKADEAASRQGPTYDPEVGAWSCPRRTGPPRRWRSLSCTPWAIASASLCADGPGCSPQTSQRAAA
jgi:hypothetical protein